MFWNIGTKTQRIIYQATSFQISYVFFSDVDSCHRPSWGISSFGGYTWSGEERWFSLCQSRSLWVSEKGSRGDSETTREWGQLPDLIFSFWRISLHICWMLTHAVVLNAVATAVILVLMSGTGWCEWLERLASVLAELFALMLPVVGKSLICRFKKHDAACSKKQRWRRHRLKEERRVVWVVDELLLVFHI